MGKYKILIDGIPVTVYPALESDGRIDKIVSELHEEETALVLLPSDSSDFRMECFYGNITEPREPHIPLAALFCFFTKVRSYPDMHLTVTYHDKEHTINLDKNVACNFAVNIGKCKILYSKSVKFHDGIEVDSNIINSNGIYAVITCEDVDFFDNARITLAYDRLKSEGVTSVIIASYSDGLKIKTSGNITFYDAVSICIHFLSLQNIKVTPAENRACVDGVMHNFSKESSSLTFYPEIKYIS